MSGFVQWRGLEFSYDLYQWSLGFNFYPSSEFGYGTWNVFLGCFRIGKRPGP